MSQDMQDDRWACGWLDRNADSLENCKKWSTRLHIEETYICPESECDIGEIAV
jgi:hypothetical protein